MEHSSGIIDQKMDSDPDVKLTLKQRIYPTPLDDQVQPKCLENRIYPTRTGARVRLSVPDISDDRTSGDNLLLTQPEPMSSLSGSVGRLKHMFETLSSPNPITTVSSASLDKQDDLPSLKVKDIAIKFSGSSDDTYVRSSNTVSCVLEKEFVTQFDNRTKDEDHAIEMLNSVLQEQEVQPKASGTSQIETVGNQLKITGGIKPVNVKPISTPEEETKQSKNSVDICDELRYDSEFLFENDRITHESLRNSSEPELSRRGTLTSQFLFGWNEGETGKNGDQEKGEKGAEENSETAEVTMHNDVVEASVNRGKNSGEIGNKGDGPQPKHDIKQVDVDLLQSSCLTQASLPEASNELTAGTSATVPKDDNSKEEIFISADYDNEKITVPEYNIPLKKSTKRDPDVIPVSYASGVASDQSEINSADIGGIQIHLPDAEVSSPADGANSSETVTDEMSETIKEPVVVPISTNAVSCAPRFPDGGISDAVCDILNNADVTYNNPVIGKDTKDEALCDSVDEQGKDKHSVINSEKPDTPVQAGHSGICSRNLPDIVQSGSPDVSGYQSGTSETEEQRLLMEHGLGTDQKNLTYNITNRNSHKGQFEGCHGDKAKVEGHVKDEDGSGTDSDDSDTVVEKDELATQSSLMDMYHTLLQRSDSRDSPPDKVIYRL